MSPCEGSVWRDLFPPSCRHGGIGRRAGFRYQCLYDVEVQVLLPTYILVLNYE